MGKSILILLLIDIFFIALRGTTDQFINGYGLFKDIWAPLLEGGIFVFVAVVGGFLFGVTGVIAGGVVSKALIIGCWKPYFLFNSGFNISVKEYVNFFVQNSIVVVVAGCVCNGILKNIPICLSDSYMHWIGFSTIAAFLYILVVVALVMFIPGGRMAVIRLGRIACHKLRNYTIV